MRNWTVGRKLGAAFATVLAFLAGVALLSVLQINRLQASSEFLRSDGLHKSQLARSAQFAARAQVTALYSLFFLDDRDARVAVYANLDQKKQQLTEALNGLRNATGATGATGGTRVTSVTETNSASKEPDIFSDVITARQTLDQCINTSVDEIELDIPSAKKLMVEKTVPQLELLDRLLDEMVTQQNRRVEAQIAANGEAGALAEKLIISFAVVALLIRPCLLTGSPAPSCSRCPAQSNLPIRLHRDGLIHRCRQVVTAN